MSEADEVPNCDLQAVSTTLPRRARVACKACNARRVKCDASEGQPCWHCRTRHTPCELLESRRGKYVRKRKSSLRNTRRTGMLVDEMDPSPLRTLIPKSAEIGDEDPNQSFDPVPVLPSPRGIANSATSSQTAEEPSSPAVQPSQSTCAHAAPSSAQVSYIVEIIYRPNEDSTESSDVHYSIPASLANRASGCQCHRTEVPTWKEALIMPPRHLTDQLVSVFFEAVHPAYPVFDRSKFVELYLENKASPLILHTIYFMAYTVGSDDIFRSAGYQDRITAKTFHYERAKALFDCDYDTDRMNVVACVLLFGFWWANPDEQKDFCYWTGCATILAQNLQMHRAAPSRMSSRERSLRKRLWWSIYVRDRHTAAAFGRPCRIRDEDCDIEPLSEEDFTFDLTLNESLIPPQYTFHVSFVIEMVKLAEILGDILISEFSPRRLPESRFEKHILAARLAQWELQLPNELQGGALSTPFDACYWAVMLRFCFQNYHILLFRPKAIESQSPIHLDNSQARAAADTITRMAEDVIAAGMIGNCQIHLYYHRIIVPSSQTDSNSVPALFGALAIHTITICRKDRVLRQLAENKSRQCLLALSELAKNWPVSVWIAKAFIKLMARLTDHPGGGSIVSVSSKIVNQAQGKSSAAGPQQPSFLQRSPAGDDNSHDITVGRNVTTLNNSNDGLHISAPSTEAFFNSPQNDDFGIDFFLQGGSNIPMLSDPFDAFMQFEA